MNANEKAIEAVAAKFKPMFAEQVALDIAREVIAAYLAALAEAAAVPPDVAGVVAALETSIRKVQNRTWDDSADNSYDRLMIEAMAGDARRAADALASLAARLEEVERDIEVFWKKEHTEAVEWAEREAARAEAAEKRLAEAGKVIAPFAEFAAGNTDEEGWAGTRCEGERIRDWFGPSEFRAARDWQEAK